MGTQARTCRCWLQASCPRWKSTLWTSDGAWGEGGEATQREPYCQGWWLVLSLSMFNVSWTILSHSIPVSVSPSSRSTDGNGAQSFYLVDFLTLSLGPCVVLRSPYPAGTTFQPVIFIAVYCFLGSLFDQTVPSYACPLPASLNLPCSVTGLNGTIVLIFWLALWGFAVSITFALFHNSIPVFCCACYRTYCLHHLLSQPLCVLPISPISSYIII